jgi:hypothetical protein
LLVSKLTKKHLQFVGVFYILGARQVASYW